jgi:hypothetical protein
MTIYMQKTLATFSYAQYLTSWSTFSIQTLTLNEVNALFSHYTEGYFMSAPI